MRIGFPGIIELGADVEYRVPVEWSGGRITLWYRVEWRFAELMTTSSDAALLALLIPAMAAGEDIHLTGAVSERLFRSLVGPYQELLRSVIPSLHSVRIHPAGFVTPRARPSGIATGFSAGVDSFCVLADAFFFNSRSEDRVTHLLFNNVGSHGREGSALFGERSARAAVAAAEIGLPLIRVDSNVDAFYGSGLGFQQTHTPRNASVALLLQAGIGRFLYASTYHLRDTGVGPSYDIAHSDPIALPMLSTESLDTVSSGGEHTRVEKTLLVARLPVSYRHLDVCSRGEGAGNCSTCAKCARTLLTLTIGGHEERYAPVLDLGAYRRLYPHHCGTVLRSQHPLNREIIAFAAAQGHSFPWRSYAASPFHAVGYVARRLARRLRTRSADGLGVGPEGESLPQGSGMSRPVTP